MQNKIDIVFEGEKGVYTIELVMEKAQIQRAAAIRRIRSAIKDPSQEDWILELSNKKMKNFKGTSHERLTPERREILRGFDGAYYRCKDKHDLYIDGRYGVPMGVIQQ